MSKLINYILQMYVSDLTQQYELLSSPIKSTQQIVVMIAQHGECP